MVKIKDSEHPRTRQIFLIFFSLQAESSSLTDRTRRSIHSPRGASVALETDRLRL